MKKARRRAQYWHGLGACPTPFAVRMIETAGMRGLPTRPNAPLECRDYVYASTSWEVALAFSTLGGGQAVCEISPNGLAAEADPDFPNLGIRFHGPVKALSVELVDESALPNARQIAETLSGDYVWPDGTPRYSPDGYLLAPPFARAWGYNDEDFRWLGRWYPLHFLLPSADGITVAINEKFRAHQMYPPDHPDLAGRRRVPLGSLDGAWRQPGVYPATTDLLKKIRVRIERDDPDLEPIRRPWDW